LPHGRFRANAQLQGNDVFRHSEHGVGVWLYQCILDAEMRPDLRVCLSPDQLHGPARLQAVHATQSRSFRVGTAVAGFLLRLCPTLDREITQTRFETAVAALPELRARHRYASLRKDRRWRDAVFITGPPSRLVRPPRRCSPPFLPAPKKGRGRAMARRG